MKVKIVVIGKGLFYQFSFTEEIGVGPTRAMLPGGMNGLIDGLVFCALLVNDRQVQYAAITLVDRCRSCRLLSEAKEQKDGKDDPGTEGSFTEAEVPLFVS